VAEESGDAGVCAVPTPAAAELASAKMAAVTKGLVARCIGRSSPLYRSSVA